MEIRMSGWLRWRSFSTIALLGVFSLPSFAFAKQGTLSVQHPALNPPSVQKKEEPPKTPPMSTSTSKRCLRYNHADNCEIYEFTKGAKGVTCTEDCLHVGHIKCDLANKCRYDEASGCFHKSVCAKHNQVWDCKVWEEELICK